MVQVIFILGYGILVTETIRLIQSPCNFYNSPGVYNVCLTVSDSFSCANKTFCDSVEIRFNPIVAFGLSDSAICLGDVINFLDSSIVSNGAIVD